MFQHDELPEIVDQHVETGDGNMDAGRLRVILITNRDVGPEGFEHLPEIAFDLGIRVEARCGCDHDAGRARVHAGI